MTERRARWVRRLLAVGKWIFFLLLPFAVLWRFAPLLSPGTIGNDYVVFPLDAQLEFVWSWSKGMVPLYVPGFGGGASSSALTLGQAWHPISWLCAIIPWYRTGSAEVVVTFLRFLELGATHAVLYRESRASGLGRASSFLLSFIAVFNGRMLDSFRYGASLEGYCGMMLACAAFSSAHRGGWTKKRITLGSLAIYLTLVSGHPQWALFGVSGAGLFALALPLCAPHFARHSIEAPTGWISQGFGPRVMRWIRLSKALRHWAGTGVVMAIGGALSAGYLLPFMTEFMAQNADRVNQEYSFTLGYGDTVRGTLSNFFRPLEADVHGAFGGSVLSLALLLAVPFVFFLRRRIPFGVLAPLLVLVVALLFSMGKATPVHRFMVDHLPLFSSFRTPGRANLWVPPMLLMVGWVVLADLDNLDLRRRWRQTPAVAIGAALALVGLIVFQLIERNTRAGNCVPNAITKVPVWATPALLAMFGVSAAMLALLRVRLEITRRVALGVCIVTTLACAAIALPFGTWHSNRKPTRTIEAVDSHHRKNLKFWGDPGFGMESKVVALARKADIPVKRTTAAVVEKFRWVDGEKRARSQVKRGLAGDEVALTKPEVPIPISESGSGRATAKATSINWNQWVFDVAAPRGGIMVFGQPNLPQWKAFVDGKLTPILTVNAVFVGVPLEPGQHEVRFEFASRSAKLGGGLFFASLAGLALYNIARRPRTRRAKVLVVVGAVVSLALIGAGAFVWYRALSPGLNVAAPAVKTS